MAKINIAIDGPSGVGKSTIADIVADKLNYVHLDTGAMYRCVAYYVLKNEIDYSNEEVLEKALSDLKISFQNDHVYLNGEDVTKEIRTNDISMMASKTSAVPMVRQKLVDLQKEIAKSKGYILDGRDICTVVLPDAEVKIFMNADAKARAQRRYDEYINIEHRHTSYCYRRSSMVCYEIHKYGRAYHVNLLIRSQFFQLKYH